MAFNVTKVGLLGSLLTTSTGDKNVYQVASGSSALVKLMWAYEGGSAAGATFEVYVASAQIYRESGNGIDSITGIRGDAGTPQHYNPASLYVYDSSNDLNPTSGYMIAPLPMEYGLQSEDSVIYRIISIAAVSMVFHVIGKEFTT